MKIERVQTRHGGFLEIIVPEDFSLAGLDMPTGDELIAAAMRYMAQVYQDAMQRIAVATTYANAAMYSYAETLDIMNDSEAMEAIREGREEMSEHKSSLDAVVKKAAAAPSMSDKERRDWEYEQIRGCRP
jgi:hypothetical protein